MGQTLRKPQIGGPVGAVAPDALAMAISPRPGVRQAVGIWPLVCWAFQRELASVVFDEVQREVFSRSYGMEYVMMRQAELGCRVDGGGRSDPHTDADVIASALGVLPEGVGGRGAALLIAETARLGRAPDWVPEPSPRCEPVEWKNGKHGRFAAREYWTGPGRWPATWLGRDHGYACPVYFADTSVQVARRRRTYLQWWGALRELRDGLRIDQPLSCFDVTLDMPPMQPWKKTGLTLRMSFD